MDVLSLSRTLVNSYIWTSSHGKLWNFVFKPRWMRTVDGTQTLGPVVKRYAFEEMEVQSPVDTFSHPLAVYVNSLRQTRIHSSLYRTVQLLYWFVLLVCLFSNNGFYNYYINVYKFQDGIQFDSMCSWARLSTLWSDHFCHSCTLVFLLCNALIFVSSCLRSYNCVCVCVRLCVCCMFERVRLHCMCPYSLS